MRQEAPFTIKLEITEGCNRLCKFCGIRGIRTKPGPPYRFMTVETIQHFCVLLDREGWNPRIEIAMRGEPMLNPNKKEILQTLRIFLPKASIMLTTNGIGIWSSPREPIEDLFRWGVNAVVIDDYMGQSEIIEKAWKASPGMVKNLAKDSKIHLYRKRKPTEHEIVLLPPIVEHVEGIHFVRKLNNMCGAAAPLNSEMAGKRCARPFREMVLTYDGLVTACCVDWRRELPIVNIHKVENIRQVWDHPTLLALRKFTYHGMRVLPPCLGCNSRSLRVGCLPDKLGKSTVPKPTKRDRRTIEAVLATGPMTTPVRRKWEVGRWEGK